MENQFLFSKIAGPYARTNYWGVTLFKTLDKLGITLETIDFRSKIRVTPSSLGLKTDNTNLSQGYYFHRNWSYQIEVGNCLTKHSCYCSMMAGDAEINKSHGIVHNHRLFPWMLLVVLWRHQNSLILTNNVLKLCELSIKGYLLSSKRQKISATEFICAMIAYQCNANWIKIQFTNKMMFKFQFLSLSSRLQNTNEPWT